MQPCHVQLGDLARDTVTGFEGVCIARTQWLNGCWRLTLQPAKLDEKGGTLKTETIDAEQVEVIKVALVKSPNRDDAPPVRRTGGPRPDVSQHEAPTRE